MKWKEGMCNTWRGPSHKGDIDRTEDVNKMWSEHFTCNGHGLDRGHIQGTQVGHAEMKSGLQGT